MCIRMCHKNELQQITETDVTRREPEGGPEWSLLRLEETTQGFPQEPLPNKLFQGHR